MKYLIDIGHPAHVHNYKNLAKVLLSKGNKVLFTTRDKEVTHSLLTYYGFDYISFGKPYKSKLGKVWGLVIFTLRLLVIAIKFKPDMYINATMYSAFVAWILRKPHISLEDTYNMEQVSIYRPFTSCILTGNYTHPTLGKKEIKYKGYHELFYLHPNVFTPDKSILNELNVTENDKYIILRFVSWNASHDIGHKGISFENKLKAINEFSKYAKVFISSESELPSELRKYKISIAPERIHDALAFASLLWAESFTMPSECSVLGTPSIVIHDTKSFYLSEQQEKYGLCFCYTESEEDQQKAISKGIQLLQTNGQKGEWIKRRNIMLSDKTDDTEFLVWFIENYPESKYIMKKSPEYQNQFSKK